MAKKQKTSYADDVQNYINDKYDKRSAFMEEYDINEYDKFIDWYMSAWNDKENRGLLDHFAKMDDYWEGDVNLPEDDNDPGSSTNIVHPNIEGEIASLIDSNISIRVKAVGPSDLPFIDVTRVMLTWCIEQNKMKRKLDVHERRRKKFGTGIFRLLFDYEFQDEFGLPTLEPVNPAYIHVDPNITNIYKIQDAEFIIESTNKSIAWARRKYGDEKADAIIPGYDPVERGDRLFGEDDGDTLSADNFIHLYVWFRDEDDEMVLVQCSACGVKLEDSRDEDSEIEFANNKFPYYFTPMYFREGTIYAKGDAELLVNTQDLVNELDDQIRINARLTGNPQRIVDIKSGINVSKLTNEAGLNIPSRDINGMKYLEKPGMPSYILDRRKYALEYESVRQTRFSDQQTGMPQKGVDTATESLALSQAAAAGTNQKKSLVEETFSDILSDMLDMMTLNYTEEQAFSITEDEETFYWFRASELNQVPKIVRATADYAKQYKDKNKRIPKYMIVKDEGGKIIRSKAKFNFYATIGAGLPSNPAFVYRMMMESMQNKAITIQEYREYMVQRWGLPVDTEMPMPEMPDNSAMAAARSGSTPNATSQGMTANGSVGG
jgi:hypothetical protein